MTILEHARECLRECRMCDDCDFDHQKGEKKEFYHLWCGTGPLQIWTNGDELRGAVIRLFADEDRWRNCPHYADRCVRLMNLEDE